MHIEPGLYFFGALLLLVLPISWLLAACLAAVIHELCHLIAVYLMGGHVSEIHFGIGGARINAGMTSLYAEAMAVLAGPMGSLALLFAARWMPKLAVCGCIQGLYNLLPVASLDGGRVLYCLLKRLCPKWAEGILDLTENVLSLLLLGAAVYGTFGLSLGIWPLMAVLPAISGQIRRKIPCKQGKIGVQ